MGVLALAGVALLAGCGGTPGPSGGGATSTVPVVMVDYDFSAPGAAKAGTVTFAIVNRGKVAHSLAVVRTDLRPNTLPTTNAGLVDRTASSVQVLGEATAVPPGSSATLTLVLPKGRYLLVCELPGHVAHGMVSGLTLTA